MSNGIYTNTSAFRRALLTGDIYSEQLREQMRLIEIQRQIQAEQDSRSSSGVLGKIVGGAIGFFAGGPAGASMGANLGGSIGLNWDNTDYASYLSHPTELMGRFNAAEGWQAHDMLKNMSEDMEDDQDSANLMSAISMLTSFATTDWSSSLNQGKAAMVPDPDNPGGFIPKVDSAGNAVMQPTWYEMDLGEKFKFYKNYKVDFKMQSFLEGLNSIADSPEDIITDIVDEASKDDGVFSNTDAFEQAYGDTIANDLETSINDLFSTVDSDVGLTNATIEDFNRNLISMGYQPITPDLFDIIATDVTIPSFEQQFPEGFNWGMFK